MEIQSDETIGQFVTRLEREASERLTLITTIRKMMPVVETATAARSANGNKPPRRSHRKIKRGHTLTLAENIAVVLKDSPRAMTQPEIRKALNAKGITGHLKNPASAISTAMSRNEGKNFQRGDGFDWKLIGKDYDLVPAI